LVVGLVVLLVGFFGRVILVISLVVLLFVLFGWLVGWLLVWLVRWLDAWLVGCFVDWLCLVINSNYRVVHTLVIFHTQHHPKHNTKRQ